MGKWKRKSLFIYLAFCFFFLFVFLFRGKTSGPLHIYFIFDQFSFAGDSQLFCHNQFLTILAYTHIWPDTFHICSSSMLNRSSGLDFLHNSGGKRRTRTRGGNLSERVTGVNRKAFYIVIYNFSAILGKVSSENGVHIFFLSFYIRRGILKEISFG